MSTLYIDNPTARLTLLGQSIEVRTSSAPPTRLPLAHIDCLVLRGRVDLDSSLLSQCWSRRISVQFLSGRRGEPTARFDGMTHNDARIRLRQSAAHLDPHTRRIVAASVVRSKLLAQRLALRSMTPTRADAHRLTLVALEALARSATQLRGNPPDLERLRGIEGAAAAAYFRAFTRLFPPSLGFATRQRRPPPDPVNATLSLAYTMATGEAARALAICGLDPAIGFLHDLGHGRPALALDLVEPLRPLADQMVLGLFRDRILTARHFTTERDGAVLLGKAGRAHFYAAWEEILPNLRARAMARSRHAARSLRTPP